MLAAVKADPTRFLALMTSLAVAVGAEAFLSPHPHSTPRNGDPST